MQVHKRAFGVGLLELVRWEMGDVRLLCLCRRFRNTGFSWVIGALKSRIDAPIHLIGAIY